ncbi:response regulator [Sphingomonas psychrotolerans]|uniref:histidine kinase n=1 Tax=Sphingomonas psychrotolerans TaxID=1327635 RepID=A0A2K8MEQ5_9SPHN|nr:response regulator [Sphingomonas psychrotolerans]ATY32337.1 histidine kinase [Sphingomonas psychrotolerans]
MVSKRPDIGRVAILSGLALICAAMVGTFFLFRAEQRADMVMVQTLQVQERLNSLVTRAQEALLGESGYLLAGDERFVARYTQAREKLHLELAALIRQMAADPAQVMAARQLDHCWRTRLSYTDVRFAWARSGRVEDARRSLRAVLDRPVTDRCRAIVIGMKAEGARQFEQQRAAADRQATLFSIWLLLCAAAVIAFALRSTLRALSTAHKTSVARDQLLNANARLHEEAASREAAETQLRQLQKMESIGQLTGGIAHDFNNMLAIVIGSLDLARRRVEHDVKRAQEHIDTAMSGAQRAAQLTSQLLAFGRRQPLAPSAFDASQLIRRLSELLRRTIGGKVDFQIDPASGLWPVRADVGQLESALVNLSLNARDAMIDGGKLVVSTANVKLDPAYAAMHPGVAPGDYVRITVRDSGTGMLPEVRDRAFEPFFTTKPMGKGTGLGLSQVYGFVKQSGGHAVIESESGSGTAVNLYLPRHKGKVAEVESWQAGPETRLPGARGSQIVLVVDDEDKVRQLAVDALRELGYIVLSASGGESALILLETQPRVDLLLTDVLMPGMHGTKLAAQVETLRPEIKLLYMSGYPSDGIVSDGMLADGVALLPKPFTVAQLAAKVRQVLDGERMPA